jgi:hypothetical protein
MSAMLNVFFDFEFNNFSIESFKVYTNCALINFSQVIDNRLQLDQAIWACRLHKSVNTQLLHYHVQKELKTRRSKAWEDSGSAIPGAPTIPDVLVVVNKRPHEQELQDGTTSPLTASTSSAAAGSSKETATISTVSLAAPAKTKTRKSSRQASMARFNDKIEREALHERYKEAFKEASTLMSDPSNDESVCNMVVRLNVKYCLIGTKKKLSRSTLY